MSASGSPSSTLPAESPSKKYSPVNLPRSPLSSQQGQLTGLPRRVRDSAAELFNAVHEWKKLHVDGMAVIEDIKDKKLDVFEEASLNNNAVNVTNSYPEGLQECCDRLENVCSQLNSVADKIKKISKNMEAIKQLEEIQKVLNPIFLTWTAEKYVSTANMVSEAYEKEAELKNFVKEKIAHVENKENLMQYCALWAHQPYIDSHLDFWIEAMLKETGHR